MKVFVFDLLAYDANLDHLKGGETELPYPLAKRHFDAGTAVRTYEEHLDAWEALDRFGYDGVGFNEHHCSPYGLMNSPNLMASAAAQRTKRLKLLIYGNLLPLHEPLRLAEELAMIDCLSNGRLISGFARGIPREYQVHNVRLADSRARFEEAYDIITRAWTEEIFSYEGKFWSYKDVAMWPRPVQQPHPPIWVGGESGPSLRRAARLGDAWYPIGSNNAHLLDSLPRYRAGVERLRTMTEAAGRRRDAVALTYRVKRTGEALPPQASDGERRLFSGSDAAIIGDIRALADLGVSAIDFDFERPDEAAVIAEMRAFKERVLARA
jgi:alkanesulfonate monooxygenase SsuD/methylene tetrahydromethanopterin reductase-like flavin-dependent oxidoreductase (luciferase family)